VITFNPELEIALSLHHPIVGLLIILKLFHVFEVRPELAAANGKKDIQTV
jgi:hypothetical protein